MSIVSLSIVFIDVVDFFEMEPKDVSDYLVMQIGDWNLLIMNLVYFYHCFFTTWAIHKVR